MYKKFITSNLQFIIGVVFLLYYIYTLFVAIKIDSYLLTTFLLIIVLYIQSIGEFIYFYKKNGKPRLQDWFRVMIFINVVLDFMKVVNNSNNMYFKFYFHTLNLTDSFYAFIIVFITYIMLDIAYVVGNSFFKKQKLNCKYAIKYRYLLLLLLFLTSLIKIYLLIAGISGYGSDIKYTTGFASLIKNIFSALNPFALIMSAYIVYIKKVKDIFFKKFFYVVFLLQVILGLLSGMKEEVILPILFVGIVYLIGGYKISKKVLLIGIFLLILLYPLNNAYRNVINNPYKNTRSHFLNLIIAIENLKNNPLEEIFNTSISSYSNRTSMYSFYQYSIKIESEWQYYKYMTRYFVLPIVWVIPRVIWENKPRSDIGAVFYEKIVGYKGQNSVTPTTLGWAYLEGGVIFVAIIFFIFGLILEFFDKKNIENPLYLLIYIFLLYKLMKPEWDVYFLLAKLIQSIILYWFLLKMFKIRKVCYD